MINNLNNAVKVAGDVGQLQDLRYNLSQSVSWLNNSTRELLKPYQITPKQYSILRNLAKEADLAFSIQEVRNGLADKMSDASRLIDRLVKKGYLEKFPSKEDRRSNLVCISISGLRILKQINARKEELDSLISDRLSEKEISKLNKLLSRLK
jgi:DNA-binding MarR family transcriptional regulator